MKHRYYKLIDEVKKKVATGNFEEAIHIFKNNPDPISATFLISHAHKNLKNFKLAFGVYSVLIASPHAKLDSFVFSSVVNACHKLGQLSHIPSVWNDILHLKMQPDARLYASLLTVCTESRDIKTIRNIISHLEATKMQPDLILQTILIKTFGKLGETTKAAALWKKIKDSAILDTQLITSILSVSADRKDLQLGKDIHENLAKRGLQFKSKQNELIVANGLINMYSKCNSLEDAQFLSLNKFIFSSLES